MPTPEQQHQINMLDPEYRKRQEETLNFNKEAPKTAESIEMAKKAAEWKDPAPVVGKEWEFSTAEIESLYIDSTSGCSSKDFYRVFEEVTEWLQSRQPQQPDPEEHRSKLAYERRDAFMDAINWLKNEYFKNR